MTDRMNPTDQATPLTQELDAAWRELEADALASDGAIRDRDVRDAIKRNRARIEAAAIATPPATEGERCGHDPAARGWDYWCIAPCHATGACDGECDPECNRCPDPCPTCERTPPATGPVVVGTMTEEEGRAFIEAATGTAPPETDTTPHASSVPHATGAVERECVCSVRADDCGLPCPCWHHTPAPAPSPSATGTVERCASDASHDWWLVPSHEAFVCRKCGDGTGVVGGPGHCYPGCFYHPAPAPSPSARVAEVRRQQSAGGGPVTAVRVSRSDDAPSPSAARDDVQEAAYRAVLMLRGTAGAGEGLALIRLLEQDGYTIVPLAAARAEAGVSLEEMGKAWAAVEAALPEHRYFKVEHDSDDDPSWYLAVWRSDGIFPDPIRWAQADTLLDGLTRLALELRTPR